MRAVITKFRNLPSHCVKQLIELEKERLKSTHMSLEDVRKRHRHGSCLYLIGDTTLLGYAEYKDTERGNNIVSIVSPSKERGAPAKLLNGLKELVPSLQCTL